MTDTRDWHEHRWWSAPTSTRCPVCGTTTISVMGLVNAVELEGVGKV